MKKPAEKKLLADIISLLAMTDAPVENVMPESLALPVGLRRGYRNLGSRVSMTRTRSFLEADPARRFDFECRETFSGMWRTELTALSFFFPQYVRNLASEIGTEYRRRGEAGPDGMEADNSDLGLPTNIPFHEHNAEPEAVDLLIEVERLDILAGHVTEATRAVPVPSSARAICPSPRMRRCSRWRTPFS